MTSSPQSAQPTPDLPSRRRRWPLRLGLTLGPLLATVLLYTGCVQMALSREIANTPRDPLTGVVLGTEAGDLGPTAAADGATSACLLLHGFVGSRQDFADLGERLAAAGYHVRLTRLPGHGTTPRDFASQTPETMYAGALEDFRRLRADYAEVDVIGFSMGGALATLLAAREDVDRLVLVAPYYGVTYRWYYVLPAEAWNAGLGWAIPYVRKNEHWVQVNRKDDIGSWYYYRTIPTAGAATLIELGKQARRSETLAAVDCPVLMVMGTQDQAASPDRAREAFESFASRRKQAVWLDRSNHLVFWDWDREAAKQAVLAFLAGASPAAP